MVVVRLINLTVKIFITGTLPPKGAIQFNYAKYKSFRKNVPSSEM
jgi:hypothetical protein